MASSNTFALFFVLLIFLVTAALADLPPSVPVAPSAACNSTLDPKFCKSVLPPQGSTTLYNYGRYSLAKSLSQANKYFRLVSKYLDKRSELSLPAIRALEDCKFLAGLNIDFLTSAGSTLNATTTLIETQTDKVQTFLSALLTNQQTCMEGLKGAASAWSVRNGLSVPLSNSTKLYSVSLALFTRAWVPRTKKIKKPGRGVLHGKVPTIHKPHHGRKGRELLFHEVEVSRDGRLPLSMSEKNREVVESRTGRRLMQAADQVMVIDVVVVSQDGTGDFINITDAVNSAPNNTDGSTGYYLIYVVSGVYQEYVSIPKNKRYLMMIGDGINQTIITGNRSVVDGWTTFNSATLAVVGQGFVAINITFQNTAGPSKHQAVAVRNGADLSTFYSCSFEAYQDTLYAHSLRQFYRDCDVHGTVDYVFGNAAAVFQSCNFYSRLPLSGQKNAVTAQGRTDPNQNTGTIIQNCNFQAAADLAANSGFAQTFLGRPWKNYSRTVIMESFMDGLIDPAGWMPWDGNFALSTLYYVEYNNTGPGSSKANRVTWPGLQLSINVTDAGNFTVGNFLLGDVWLPQTGVPYASGFI